MKRVLKYALVFLVAVLGGFAGGVVSSAYLANANAARVVRELIPGPDTVIRASAFQLVDERGRLRGELSLKGRPALEFMDDHGNSQVLLQGGDEPLLGLSDKKLEGRVVLGNLGHGDVEGEAPGHTWALEFRAQNGSTVARIVTENGSNGRIEIWDAQAKRMWSAPR
jgi:hypothetical protein